MTSPLLFPPSQAMDSPYANGAYSPPYPTPHYTGLPQTRGYHCSGPPYPSEPAGRYRCPSPAPPWSYTAPDGPNEGSSLRRQQGPSYSPPQDIAYDKPEHGTDHHSYYPDGNHQHCGTVNDHKPAPPPPKVQYSAQPQLYDSAPRKPWAGNRELKPGEHQAAVHSAAIQPGIQRILHVMGEAEQLEEEVDEFVGKKTDKSYRLLEEMLTKLLLELDSVETGGQESVRQARKESVHRIQAILEKLERKGL
ncbi:BAG family molecular chaperone regulator 4-like protein [Amazona aestiva]|uniref:BAG family molecular chaperone regulator 4-like protein n=1 Tax=Amazona aestiva TaxID=12930 RepID=A0A0Q3PMS4_AMAAE|nr:BAG family molecular chaperone regulator 4-like protein [Amazona aestiva]